MAVRIRVYPNYGMGAYGGVGGYGGYGVTPYASQLYNTKIANVKQTSALRLAYERALFAERLKLAQLQAQLQYGGYAGGFTPLASPYMLNGGMLGAGMLGAGAVPSMLGGFGGLGLMGRGQVNVTNQTAAGAANQTVTNNNSYVNTRTMSGMPVPYPMYYQRPGLLGGLLDGLF